MAKLLTIPIVFSIFASFLLGGFFAVPADAAELKGPKEGCEINPKNIPFDKFTIFKRITSEKVGKDDAKGFISENGTIKGETDVKYKSKDWAIICLIDTIGTITDWIFFALITISALFIIYAAFLFMTSGSVPANQEKAGKMILAALVGIAIALLSRIIPGIVTGLLA